jgi:hypothetical protein
LEAIARSAQKRQIRHSVETGSGASTLLFSHLSDDHTVFAFDSGSGSVTNVRRSPLLRQGAVTFVEGPTQATLPRHRFTEKLQLVLINGPHGCSRTSSITIYIPTWRPARFWFWTTFTFRPSTTFFNFCGAMRCLNWTRWFKRQRFSHALVRRCLILWGWMVATELQCSVAPALHLAGQDPKPGAGVDAPKRGADQTRISTGQSAITYGEICDRRGISDGEEGRA